MLNLNGKSILITGGTGSFGNAFIRRVLKDYPDVKRIVVFSRDEFKQFNMQQQLSTKEYPCLRYFIGDVRDKERLVRALEGIDIVIHAAAIKQIVAAEYNPFETIKTNIIGAQNIIDASFKQNVKQIIALSTDKAAAPINLYGATKLCSDKLFIASNNFKGQRDLKVSVVRYGNVMGSRGSVIPFFIEKREDGFLPVTHKDMTRFNITLDEGVELVFMALEEQWGGEIFVPKIPSYKIMDVVEAVAPGIEVREVGIRPGEKLHEEMITETDGMNTIEFKSYYVILPSIPLWDISKFIEKHKGQRKEYGFKYNSGTNDEWVSVNEIRELIKTHCDPDFKPKTQG